MRKIILTLIITLSFIFTGCTKAINPFAPDSISDSDSGSPGSAESFIMSSGTMNLETGTVMIESRSLMPYLNVTSYVVSNFNFTINGVIPPDILDITLEINNPSFYVHDVCIVFENLYGKTVVNPDSYIDLWQPYDLDPVIQFIKQAENRYFYPTIDTEQLLLK